MGLFLVKFLTTVGWAVIHVWSHLSSFIVHTRALLGIQLKTKYGKNVSWIQIDECLQIWQLWASDDLFVSWFWKLSGYSITEDLSNTVKPVLSRLVLNVSFFLLITVKRSCIKKSPGLYYVVAFTFSAVPTSLIFYCLHLKTSPPPSPSWTVTLTRCTIMTSAIDTLCMTFSCLLPPFWCKKR